AHPVALGEGKMDSVMADKVTNDATATIRAIAQVRQRNVRWAEDAVRRSLSLTDREALDSGVVDLVVPTETDLLRELDGRTMRVGTEQRILHLDSPRIERVEMNWLEKFFHIITDPNIALLLLSLGFFAIVIEFYTPGTFGPAIAGAILLILGFMATGSLPLNWAGVLLLLLAAILLVVELYTPTVGVFAIGSALAFVLGALILFTPTAPTSPSLPQVSVNSGLIAALAALVLIIGILLARVAVRTQRSRPHSGVELLLGQSGIAKTDLSPIGTVLVNSEEWSAENVGADIVARGDHVEVVGIRGTVLQVHKSTAISPPADG
ncbi:MAG: nodulation protein NfeD, partial [Chlorobi bacterium]|nr:nodulation protein NfeD [Chlorobiota bacterium]